jgi:hypothetical protein
MLGGGAADIISLIKGGYEVSECNFSFQQGVDDKGKATTRVYGGTLHIVLLQLPPKPIIEWALNSRKYMDGVIVSVDDENIPIEKILFKNATCINFGTGYEQVGECYTETRLIIHAEQLIVGTGVTFTNEWIY